MVDNQPDEQHPFLPIEAHNLQFKSSIGHLSRQGDAKASQVLEVCTPKPPAPPARPGPAPTKTSGSPLARRGLPLMELPPMELHPCLHMTSLEPLLLGVVRRRAVELSFYAQSSLHVP